MTTIETQQNEVKLTGKLGVFSLVLLVIILEVARLRQVQ